MRSTRRVDGLLIVVLALYMTASVWMAFRLPANAVPNELLNYEYVSVIRQTGMLPRRGAVDFHTRYNEWHQPPLYFVFAAATSLPFPPPERNQDPQPNPFFPSDPNATLDRTFDVPPPLTVEVNRFFTSSNEGNRNPILHYGPQDAPVLYASRVAASLMGMMAIVALYWAGKRAFSAETALLIVSFMAFHPGFVHLSGAVNNDMPLTAITAIILAATTWMMIEERPPWLFLVWGVICALAPLTKASGAFIIILFPPVLLFKWNRAGFRDVAKSGLFALMGFGLPWGAWLLRNAILTHDTLGVSGSFPVKSVILQNPLNFRHLIPELPAIWQSFWMDWSAGGIGHGPDWFYWLWFVLTLVALGGWFKRAHGASAPVVLSSAFLLSGAATLYLYLAVKTLTIMGAGYIVPEGRWALPLLPVLAWFVGAGLARWWSPERRCRPLLAAACLPPISTFILLAVWLPYLYPRARVVADVPADAQIIGRIYDDTLELLAVEMEPMTVGVQSDATLYWRALRQPEVDYAFSTQLLMLGDDGWVKLEEQNSHNGLGLSPSSRWKAGELMADRMPLLPRGELNGPTQTFLMVSLLDGDGDALPLVGKVVIRPNSPLSPSPAAQLESPVEFAGLFELIGVENDGRQVTLWWRVLQDVPQEIATFIHLTDENGQLLGQSDAVPDGGRSPTIIWEAGDVIRDRHTIAVGDAVFMLIGAYDSSTLVRLVATQSGKPLPDNVLQLEAE